MEAPNLKTCFTHPSAAQQVWNEVKDENDCRETAGSESRSSEWVEELNRRVAEAYTEVQIREEVARDAESKMDDARERWERLVAELRRASSSTEKVSRRSGSEAGKHEKGTISGLFPLLFIKLFKSKK